MLILQNLQYKHPNKELLFAPLQWSAEPFQKIALIGNNGVGKSTLLKIIAGELAPTEGKIITNSKPYYVPQLFGQCNNWSIAQALQVEDKLRSLKAIISGDTSEHHFALLNDDWMIEERCQDALIHWQLDELDICQPLAQLSGGQKTRIFLAGIMIHSPEIVLLDEPSNHLDASGRNLLYEWIQSYHGTLIMVSHDRYLLRLAEKVLELTKRGINVYGGNYDFYLEQKQIELEALQQDVKSKEKALRKAKETERETIERQQKLDARGRKKQEKAGVPTIALNTLRNNAEKSTARIKGIHEEKIGSLATDLNELRKELPDIDKMKLDFDQSKLHKGKILFGAKNINHQYKDKWLWNEPMNIEILSAERVALKGDNGSGKTTLIKIMLGALQPLTGDVFRADSSIIYIDQEYSLIDNQLNVFEQLSQYNKTALQEHELKIRLNRFLFGKEEWNKSCANLSGGEKMRLMLCCLNISQQAPDMIILDEPTNNLDIQNIEILTTALKSYGGTLLVVSHDSYFLEEINVGRAIKIVS